MPTKRALDPSSTPPPAAKRFAIPSSDAPDASSSSIFSTPYTPRTYTLPPPSDSPTNPFGFSRLTSANPFVLPKSTSFAKHATLRVQLIAHPSEANTAAYGRVKPFRIVSVPMNYTFRLLQKLVLFLFECEPDPAFLAPRNKEEGHLFEVYKSVRMHTEPARIGEIKNGRKVVKLSSIRDPYYRYVNGRGFDQEDEDEDEDTSCDWENEDEFLLSNVWPRGADTKRGIVYHHNEHTTLHLTINTVSIPPRKGMGNKPFIFHARGRVDLDALPSDVHSPESTPVSLSPSVPQAKKSWNPFQAVTGRTTLSVTNQRNGQSSLPLLPSFISNMRRGRNTRDSDDPISVLRWNAHAVWDNYLDRTRVCERRRTLAEQRRAAMVKHEQGDDDLRFPSSDSFADAPALTSSSPFSLDSDPVIMPPTPGPTQPLHKLLVNRASRRLSKLTNKGMPLLESESEEEPEADVDQLEAGFYAEPENDPHRFVEAEVYGEVPDAPVKAGRGFFGKRGPNLKSVWSWDSQPQEQEEEPRWDVWGDEEVL